MAELRKLDLSCIESDDKRVTKLLPQSTLGQLTVIRLVLHDGRRGKIENLTQRVPDSLLLAIGTL